MRGARERKIKNDFEKKMQTKEKMENTDEIKLMLSELRDKREAFMKQLYKSFMKQSIEMEIMAEEGKEIIKKMENIKRIQDTENKYVLFYINCCCDKYYDFIGIIDSPTNYRIAEEMAEKYANKYGHSLKDFKNKLYEGNRGEEGEMDSYVLEKNWNINKIK